MASLALGVGPNVSRLQPALKRIPAVSLHRRHLHLLLFSSGAPLIYTQISVVSSFASFLFAQCLLQVFNIRFLYAHRTVNHFGRVLRLSISAGRASLGLGCCHSVRYCSMLSTDLTSILSSDALLGCVFLAAIALVSLKLFPTVLILGKHSVAPSISTAIAAYKSYEKASKSSARQMRTAFHAGLRTARNTTRIANEIGYAEKLERLERAIEVNAAVSCDIYRLATAKGEGMSLGSVVEDVYVGVEDHAKVREALKHFMRDWSEDGRGERSQAFGLVLDALKRFEREVSGRRGKRVLVPGAGLGRLAWEISQLGLSFIVRLPLDSTLLTLLVRIRYDRERAFALYEPRVQIPALSSNNARSGPTQATPLHPLVVSPTIHILNIPTGLVPRHHPTALRHVPP